MSRGALRIAAGLWLMAGAVAAGCTRAPEPLRFVGTLERDRIEIASEAAEPIVSIAVQEGEHVSRGQLLLRQDTAATAARLAGAEAAIEEARQRLQELEHGPRAETLQESRARLAAARAALERDERELARLEDLVARRLVSQAEADRARATRDRSLAAREETQAQLAALLHGTRREQLAQARAALAAAEAARRELEVGEGRLEVRASRSGLVEALPYELGERPPPGAPVAVLLASDRAYARIYVPEPARASVAAGAGAHIFVDGLAAPLQGRVRYVASQASFTPYFALTQRDRSRLVFLAEVDVLGTAATRLAAGVPVEVEIEGARRD